MKSRVKIHITCEQDDIRQTVIGKLEKITASLRQGATMPTDKPIKDDYGNTIGFFQYEDYSMTEET